MNGACFPAGPRALRVARAPWTGQRHWSWTASQVQRLSELPLLLCKEPWCLASALTSQAADVFLCVKLSTRAGF